VGLQLEAAVGGIGGVDERFAGVARSGIGDDRRFDGEIGVKRDGGDILEHGAEWHAVGVFLRDVGVAIEEAEAFGLGVRCMFAAANPRQKMDVAEGMRFAGGVVHQAMGGGDDEVRADQRAGALAKRAIATDVDLPDGIPGAARFCDGLAIIGADDAGSGRIGTDGG